jgi:EpsD family peptidyl-prolyl cis-trans isomerase
MHQKTSKYAGLLFSTFLLVTLSACGDKSDTGGKSETETQVVAKVNGDEITVHQLNFELSAMGQAAGSGAEQRMRQVGEQIVNQQLLMQKAVETKLDRDPRIMQALERARRQVLAQAYLDKTVGNVTPPSKSEADAYYSQHPELFSKRRIYQLREIVMDKSIPFAELQAKVSSVKSSDELGQWLQAKKVEAKVANIVRPAEQLPFDMLAKVSQMQNGEIAAFESPSNNVLLFLAGSQEQPISQEQAAPIIERFLVNKKRKDLAEAEVKRLRETAKIEWLGKFAAGAAADKNTPAAASPSSPSANHDPKKDDADFIGKGVSDF